MTFVTSFIAALSIICIFVVPVLAVAFVLVKWIGSNKKERMELARHGIVPPVQAMPSPNKYRSLRNGVLCIGVATGMIAGLLIISRRTYGYQGDFLIVCSSTILCLGLSYIVFYLLVKDKKIENEEE
jgi:hypothetical protein